ncbi:hypothetical protein AVEN_228679-1 [Araneus ventricosus]|uniref:Tc1-like transposase DDE domain-containing protein n=1 Tax=Araneus ventricosus TaxID=182803 RepID=A0A4Y2KI45_ARAVE|nr:hypothetical protein AVEN_228679-1 [Araneus ventricosus]
MAFVFPTGNGIFQQDNAPSYKARIVLEWFEEHADEFHLMSWPPNLPSLNSMEHIWDVMERQLRAQTPPYPNISDMVAVTNLFNKEKISQICIYGILTKNRMKFL